MNLWSITNRNLLLHYEIKRINKNLNSYQIPRKEGNGAKFLHSNNKCSKKGLFRFFLKDETRLPYDTSISNTASSIVQFFTHNSIFTNKLRMPKPKQKFE